MKSTRRTLRLVRLVLIAAAASATLWLVLLNRRLYKPGRVETAIAQLQFLEQSLADGEADRMQALFPEGYVFQLGTVWPGIGTGGACAAAVG